MIRRYSELRRIDSFEERFRYLSIRGEVGVATFGFDRVINQMFYNSVQWKQIREQVIVRDNGCDLGFPDREIFSRLMVHHMNPIKIEDIESGIEDILNPEYLVTVSHRTHNAIHFGTERQLSKPYSPRTRGDTKLW